MRASAASNGARCASSNGVGSPEPPSLAAGIQHHSGHEDRLPFPACSRSNGRDLAMGEVVETATRRFADAVRTTTNEDGNVRSLNQAKALTWKARTGFT